MKCPSVPKFLFFCVVLPERKRTVVTITAHTVDDDAFYLFECPSVVFVLRSLA